MSVVASLTDHSGTITTGGTSQLALAANGGRRYLFVQNPRDETTTLFVDESQSAAANSAIELAPGAAWEFCAPSFVPSGAIHVNAAETGHNFIIKEA